MLERTAKNRHRQRERSRNRQLGIQRDKFIKSYSDSQACEERASVHPDEIKSFLTLACMFM